MACDTGEIEVAETRLKDLTYRQTVLTRRTSNLDEQSDKSNSDRRLALASRTTKVLAV